MDEDQQPREYWEGVQEALNLMKDFMYWKDLNPNEARTLKEFVVDTIDIIGKHTDPRLRDLLKLGFKNRLDNE